MMENKIIQLIHQIKSDYGNDAYVGITGDRYFENVNQNLRRLWGSIEEMSISSLDTYVTAIVGLVVSDIIRAYLGLPLEFFSLVDIVDQTAFGFFRTEFDKAVFGYAFAAVNLGIQLATFLLPSDLFTSAILMFLLA